MSRMRGENRYHVDVLQPCRFLARLSIYCSVEEFLADSIWRDSNLILNRGHNLSYIANFYNGVVQ